MRGKKSLGAPDPHRAGLQVLYDATDGAVTFVSSAAAFCNAADAVPTRGDGLDIVDVPEGHSGKALVWLQATLRTADNAILSRAAALGRSGLEVVVVWRHGRKVPTPAASFMAHAMRALNSRLRALGSGLVVLHAADESEESAAEAVAARALQLGVDHVVVDACEAAGAAGAGLVTAALPNPNHNHDSNPNPNPNPNPDPEP